VKPQLLTMVRRHSQSLATKGRRSPLRQVDQEFPNSTSRGDAGFERRHVAFYLDQQLRPGPEVDNYTQSHPDAPKRARGAAHEGGVLFKNADYASAAADYGASTSIPTRTASVQGEALLKLAFCQIQNRDFERAVKTYTSFIGSFPSHKSVPTALFQRGIANLRLKATAAALKDFEQLITKHPKARERETALQQKALVLGQQNDNEAMAETFRILLKEYPETPAAVAAEGNYWIGWVAYENKDIRRQRQRWRRRAISTRSNTSSARVCGDALLLLPGG
jgi:TolA-binding protein